MTPRAHHAVPGPLEDRAQDRSGAVGYPCALLLGGFVILASASISISDNAAGNPFFYIQRQLLAAAIGAVAGAICLFIPMQVWRNSGR